MYIVWILAGINLFALGYGFCILSNKDKFLVAPTQQPEPPPATAPPRSIWRGKSNEL